MPEYQKRIVEEKKELDSKLGKLTEFTQSEKFSQLDMAEASRLTRQRLIMELYSFVLAERILAF